MKKLTALFLVLAMMFALSACKTPIWGKNQDFGQSPADSAGDAFESQGAEGATGDGQTKSPEESKDGQKFSDKTVKDGFKEYISAERAVEIALKAAGLSKGDVFDIDAELDKEVFGTLWEVDFETREFEYTYDIDAKTSEIVYNTKERND